MKKQIILGAILIAQASMLYPAGAPVLVKQTNSSRRSSAQAMKQACDNGIQKAGDGARYLYKNRASKAARIIGNSLKIIGGFALIATTRTIVSASRYHQDCYEKPEDVKDEPDDDKEEETPSPSEPAAPDNDRGMELFAQLATVNQAVRREYQNRITEHEPAPAPAPVKSKTKTDVVYHRISPVPEPAHKTMMAIAVCIIGEGCYGIYKALKPSKKK